MENKTRQVPLEIEWYSVTTADQDTIFGICHTLCIGHRVDFIDRHFRDGSWLMSLLCLDRAVKNAYTGPINGRRGKRGNR